MKTEDAASLEARIRDLLTRARSVRLVRLLKPDDVLELVQLLRESPHLRYVYRHGGTVAAGYRRPSQTTIAMAARVGGKLYLGIGVGPAVSPSLGRVWTCLQPFGRGTAEENDARFAAWTRESNVFCLEPYDRCLRQPLRRTAAARTWHSRSTRGRPNASHASSSSTQS